MSGWKKLAQAAAASGEPVNIEGVFQNYLYRGTGSSRTITNNIDLSTEGGMVWIKNRDSSSNHVVTDTVRNWPYHLIPNSNADEQTSVQNLTGFTTSGFTLGTNALVNNNNTKFASWTFKNQERFFTHLKYTGDGTSSRNISHDLNHTVGFMAIKCISTNQPWVCYHREVGATKYLSLNSDGAPNTSSTHFNNTAPTSTQFTVGSNDHVNESGRQYMAYIWAHHNNDGEFGPDGDQDAIKCGGYTGDGTTNQTKFIDVGFEPQWIIIRRLDSFSDWHMYDAGRGVSRGTGGIEEFEANTTDAEAATSLKCIFRPKGFIVAQAQTNTSSTDYIYIAIRRGPMAVPESVSDVFAPQDEKVNYTSNTDGHSFNSGFPVDSFFYKGVLNSTSGNEWYDRTRPFRLFTDDSTAQDTNFNNWIFDKMEGAYEYGGSTSTNNVAWMWRRATGFFDTVEYRGTGSSSLTLDHNLGVVPEMMWVKRTSGTSDWKVYHKDLPNLNSFLRLNHAFASNNSQTNVWTTAPTATQFTIGNYTGDYTGGGDFGFAWLFATLSGISKVGSYSGNSSTQTIDCGFSNGASLVFVKAYSTSGQWIAWDSARGIVSGNEPFLRINSTVAQETGYDAIDPHSSGFTLNNVGTGTNDSGTDYIFYAVAAP